MHMQRKSILGLVCSLLLSGAVAPVGAQVKDNRFEVSKNLDIFNALVKEVEMFYVDTVDVEKTVRRGINAMLGGLDPYTEYIPEEEMGDFKQMVTGEYGGIKGFRNVYDKLEIEFKDENEARNILELARYANVHTQKPLTESELKFIYHYPDIAAKIMTVSPFYNPVGELQKRLERGSVAMPHQII